MKNTTRYRALLLILLMLVGTFAFPLDFNVEAIGTGYFGYNGVETGAGEVITDIIHGTNFTLNRTVTLQSITAKVCSLTGVTTVRYGLYYQGNRTLIASTASGANGGINYVGNWKTLAFSSPPTVPAGNYILAAWGSAGAPGDVSARLNVTTGTANQMPYQSLAYGSYPNPLVPGGFHSSKGCIYANYTYVTAPAVTTNTSTGAEETNVTMNGFVTDDGGEDVTFDFQYGLTTGYGSDTSDALASTGETVNINQGSLTPGKLYHYRARAVNTNTTSYGSDKTFLTKPNEPTGLTISHTGSLEQTIRWTHGEGYNRSVVRGTIGSYPSSPQTGTAIYNGTSDNVVRVGLTAGNVWYYRVWEYMTWNGTSMFSDAYDEGFLVVTATMAPNVTTNDPTVGKTYAVLNGEITDDGGAFCKAYFQYGLTTGYGTNTTIESIPWGEGFDDDAVGGNPSSDWYTYSETGGDYGVVSNTVNHSSPNSFKKTGGIGKYSQFLFNEGITPSSFSIWAYFTDGAQQWYANSTGGVMATFLICDAASWTPQVNFTYPGTIDLYAQINEWVKITFDFNWSTSKYRLSVANATSSSSSTWTTTVLTNLRAIRIGQLSSTTNYFDDLSFPLSDGNFSFNASGLNRSTVYHYRAVGKNTNGTNIGYGVDRGFITSPDEPGNFTATDINTNHTQHLTWTHGAGYNRTVIRVGTAGFPADPQSGSSVYNGTGTGCYYSTVLPGQLYYYRAWEYAISGAYHQFSTWSRIGCLTCPSSITNMSVTTSTAPWVNLSWTKGLGANRTVLVLKEGSYPTSISDGTVIYNDTGSTYRYNMENYSSAFITAWSFSTWTYNPTVTAISSNGTMWTLGKYLGVDVYNESDPSMALVFNIQIRNADGTEVVQYMNQSGFTFINMSGFTTTQDVFLRAWSTDYQAREMYLEDFTSGYYYNVTFYLPKKVIDTGEDPEGGGGTVEETLRAYIDSISVTSFAVDCVVPLTHTIESIINVEVYKNIGGFGDWVDVPQNKFTVYTTNVTINKTVLDANTTMARVNYYYWTYSGEISTPVYYIRVVETIETEYSMYDKALQGATVTVRRFMNTTGKYEIVSILLADANGYVNLYLIPNVQYLLTAEKTDYDTTNSSFIPVPPNALGQTAEKILRMVQTGIVAPPYNYSYLMKNIIWDYSPKGLQIEGAFTFYFNITSSDSQLDWYSLTVFRYNYTTRVWDNLSYQIAYLPGGGSLSYNVPNVTGRYAFECWFKKDGFDPYELSQTGSFEKLLVFFQDWMKQIPDEGIYLVLVVIMMIVAGFCFMYLGTGILTGYIALGIMAIGLLFVGDVNVPIGNAVTISGWIIFAITFIVYTFAIFLWSRM